MTTGFTTQGGALALAGAAAVLGLGIVRDDLPLVWGLAGWGIPAGLTLVAGAWLVRLHGRAGPRFLAVTLGSVLARLAAAGAGTLAAGWTGADAVRAYLVGLVLGFVPLQAHEMVWFHRAAASERAASGAN